MEKIRPTAEDGDVPNHPCHRLSVPLARLFWCRHCMQTFSDPISRWRHSKECKTESYDKHLKRKSKEAHALQLFAHTAALAEHQLHQKNPQPNKVPRIHPPEFCDLKCFICHQIFDSLYEMREHVKIPCHRPPYMEEEYIEHEEEVTQPGMIIVKDGDVLQAVEAVDSIVSQDQLQNLQSEVSRNTEWLTPMEMLAHASKSVQSLADNAVPIKQELYSSRNSHLTHTVMRVERNLSASGINDKNFPMELLVQASEMVQPNNNSSNSNDNLAVRVEHVPIHSSHPDMELLVQASELVQNNSLATTTASSFSTTGTEITTEALIENIGVASVQGEEAAELDGHREYYNISTTAQGESTGHQIALIANDLSGSLNDQSIYVTREDGTSEKIIIQAAHGEEIGEEDTFTIDPALAQSMGIPIDSNGAPIRLENMELLTDVDDESGQQVVYVVVV